MKEAIKIVERLLEECCFPTLYYGQKWIYYEYEIYRSSGLEEIKMELQRNRQKNPILVLENFRDRMDTYACIAKGGSANLIFSTYYDVATEVLDQLLIKENQNDCHSM